MTQKNEDEFLNFFQEIFISIKQKLTSECKFMILIWLDLLEILTHTITHIIRICNKINSQQLLEVDVIKICLEIIPS